MAKVALLIGVSEYEPGLTRLAAAVKDVEAMQRVLQDVELGGFNDVKTLPNPDRQTMQEEIETLFSERARDDIVLLFFSGHGIKDDSGNLYFATRTTRQSRFMSTAVDASFVHRIMEKCRSRRQVVILDCCFSGAFAEGLSAKDDGSVDIKKQLGGEGRAVLTSSTSTQRSFEHQGFDLSIYTHFLVEGLRTGVADRDNDGAVSVDELHQYACEKVQETAPAKMKPEIYPIKDGGKILLAKVKIDDPRLRYRREVERFANRGEISFTNRMTLEELRDSLKLSSKETIEIEEEVLKPHKEYKRKLQLYEKALDKEIERKYPLGSDARNDLKRLQQVLGLRDEDVAKMEEGIILGKELNLTNQVTSPTEPVQFAPKDAETGNKTISAVENNRTTKSTPTESQTPDIRSQQKLSSTQTSVSNSQSLLAKIALAKNQLLAVSAFLLVGLTGFQIYRKTTSINPRYTQLQNLLSAAKWKEADYETAQKMWEVVGRQKERSLRVEDFENFPCEDLRTIDNLWSKYSKKHFGFSVQRRIWKDVNSDFDKFVIRVKWGHQKNNEPSFDYYYLMDGFTFDLSEPEGHLPWAPTYYGGNNETRQKYISRILYCGI